MTDQAVTPDIPDLAHDAWGLATWGIIAVIAIAVAAVYFGMRQLSVQRGTHTAVCAIRTQVENDHESNMRDDFDEVAGDVKELKQQGVSTQAAVEILTDEVRLMRTLLTEFGRDVTGLRRDDGIIRGELREHAEAHRALETRVVQAFRREHPDAEPL